jgi:hypothetical protein
VNPSVTRYTLWKNQRRRWVQWALAPIVILVIALGWKYPYLGYTNKNWGQANNSKYFSKRCGNRPFSIL